jgi:tRNA G18 (ribose-2'-O)-methylase SpoU
VNGDLPAVAARIAGTVLPVHDPDDSRIVEFLGLRDHELRMRRERRGGDMAGVFVAEGDLVVERALRAGHRLLKLLVDGTRTRPLPDVVPADTPVYAAGPAVLQRVTGYHMHRGVIACFERGPERTAAEVLAGARTLVVLERVQNPTNLGVIVRSAAGLGIDGLLLDPSTADPLYRRASRVAMGEVFCVPYARLEPLPGGLDPLRAAGIAVLALTPDPAAEPIQALRFAPGARVALLLGAEGEGLAPATMGAVDRWIRIPMHRGVDSLNVGAAAAVACYAVADAVARAG